MNSVKLVRERVRFCSVLAAAVAVVAVAASTAAGGPYSASMPAVISGLSPFSSCDFGALQAALPTRARKWSRVAGSAEEMVQRMATGVARGRTCSWFAIARLTCHWSGDGRGWAGAGLCPDSSRPPRSGPVRIWSSPVTIRGPMAGTGVDAVIRARRRS
jgi:hypothetical protein